MGERGAPEGEDTVALPEVEDPMLVPLSPAPNTLKSFRQAREMVERRSPDLAIARADVERARGRWRQALAGALPSAAGTASFTGRLLKPSDNLLNQADYSYLAQLSATQPLFDLAAWHAIGTASVLEDQASLSRDEQRRVVLGGVAEAVLAVAVAERTAELNRAGLRAALAIHSIWSRREELGGANRLDLARFAQDVAAARLAVIEADETVQRAREALGVALGTTEPWGVAPGVGLTAVEGELRQVCHPADGVLERADVAAARLGVEVAERNVKQVELEFVPTVDLVTAVGVTSGFRDTSPNPNFTVGGVLSWSIWDGGFRYGSLRSARADVVAARARLDDQARGASIEERQALRAVTVAEQALRSSEAARDLAREANRLTVIAFRAGAGSSLDLVQAAQVLRRAEIETALREFVLVRAEIGALLVAARCAP